jgi:K+-transporting ATPase ATPase C chain
MVRRQLAAGLAMTAVMIVLTGILYPLAVTGAGQLLFPHRADGSLVEQNGKVVGSALLGQSFSDPRYFWPRPSAAGKDGYDGLASAGSNLGPSNPKLLDAVSERVAAYREANHLGADDPVPVDAVTASASGLDPQISVANARLQATRVAEARGVDPPTVLRLVDAHTEHRQWGFLGEDAVNVLQLNLALDQGGRS